MNVPFLDLKTPHARLREDLLRSIEPALLNAQFIGGESVIGFETEFASFCGSPQCIGVSSGTDALRFALIAAGIREGDTIITVPNTFIATTEAISQSGAEIFFTDVDERTHQMDPDALEKTVRKPMDKNIPAKAVIPVHL